MTDFILTKEEEFCKAVIDFYNSVDDRILNVIIKTAEEMNIEVECIPDYLDQKVISILEEECFDFNLFDKTKHTKNLTHELF